MLFTLYCHLYKMILFPINPGYEKYQQIRNDPCLYFYHKIGPYQIDEKAPETPESIANPASVERYLAIFTYTSVSYVIVV